MPKSELPGRAASSAPGPAPARLRRPRRVGAGADGAQPDDRREGSVHVAGPALDFKDRLPAGDRQFEVKCCALLAQGGDFFN